ncbi:MAG: hypothetical protein QM727_15625 [Niabella sp.]
MKGYRRFIFVFAALFVVYIIVRITAPDPINWNVTLSGEDKNPYGAYILTNSLDTLFGKGVVKKVRKDLFNTLRERKETTNGAYIAIAPALSVDSLSGATLLGFVKRGNTVFLSGNVPDHFLDSLGLDVAYMPSFTFGDSTPINLSNPAIKRKKDYTCRTISFDYYFDSIKNKYPTSILGVCGKDGKRPNFLRLQIGKGQLLLHCSPLAFSNYFLIRNGNEQYVADALSYIPSTVREVIWDNYYTLGSEGSQTPFRYFLQNYWLAAGLYISTLLLLLYAFFNGKRLQKVIPAIKPPANTTADFVKTISALYYNKNSNKEIAQKKLQYWLSYIRKSYYLDTQQLDDSFVQKLVHKSGVQADIIRDILNNVPSEFGNFSDADLIRLNKKLSTFYEQAKS